MKFLRFLLISLLICAIEAQKSYRNHKIIVLNIENNDQLAEIQNLELQSGFTFIDPPVQTNMDVELVIQPESFEYFQEIAENFNIKFKITSEDLQSAIDAEKPFNNRKAGFSLDNYNILEDIYQFLDETEAAHSEVATLITIGESFEGNPLKVMKITKNENNPAIFIEANIHAREWISSATAIWLINEILTTTNAEIREVIDSVTWYILPMTNPDGYQYSHDVDRLWRKNRSIHNVFCRGVDSNRNFGYNFRMGGSSTNPCTDTYSGPEAFSEKETRALMDFYSTIANKAEAYISFHSAAEMLLYPMGHTASDELVPNKEHLHEIATVAVEAIKARNDVTYQFGNVVDVLYVASGSSPDHAYGEFNTPIAFTFEFRTGRGTESRFILPREEIIPNSEEVFDSLLAIIKKSKELGYFKAKED